MTDALTDRRRYESLSALQHLAIEDRKLVTISLSIVVGLQVSILLRRAADCHYLESGPGM
jgi:hypothetical protein